MPAWFRGHKLVEKGLDQSVFIPAPGGKIETPTGEVSEFQLRQLTV